MKRQESTFETLQDEILERISAGARPADVGTDPLFSHDGEMGNDDAGDGKCGG